MRSTAAPRPSQVITFLRVPTVLTWTNMPAALTEFNGATFPRTQVDLSAMVQFRVQAIRGLGGLAGSKLRVRYSVDAGTNWIDIEATGTAADLAIDTVGHSFGTWGVLATGARADVLISPWGLGGDGIVDPTFSSIGVEFRGA